MLLPLAACLTLSHALISAPISNLTLPPSVLDQFLDYDLVIHFDNSSGNINFLAQLELYRKHNHQTVHLINYEARGSRRLLQRPKGYKYINIILLRDPFSFQRFSIKPYAFQQYDFVVFATTRIQETQIWRMAGLQRAAGVFVYDTGEGQMFQCCYFCGKETAVLGPAKMFQLRKYLNDYSDFRGHVFRIAYANFPPFFWKGPKEKKPRGAEGTLLQEFSRVHNFRYKLIEYRSSSGKGAWQAMVDAVEANAIDWAVGGLSASLRRGTFTDFTRYIKNQGFGISYAIYQDTWTTFESILLVFEWPIWISIVCIIFALCYIAKLTTRGHFTTYFRLASSSIVEQTASGNQMKLVKISTLRLLFFVWWLACLNLTSMYKSQLASCLIQPSYNEPKRIDDLVARDFHFLVNSEDWSVLRENLETSLDKVYSRVLKRVDGDLDFCQAILALDGQKLAVIDEESSMEYDIFTRCESVTPKYRSRLRLVSENIFPNSYHAWSMPMGTPFRLKFSKTIGRMDDYGLIDHWYKAALFFQIPRSNSRAEGSKTTPLTLAQILPPLMILGIGLCAAFAVLVIEIYVKKTK